MAAGRVPEELMRKHEDEQRRARDSVREVGVGNDVVGELDALRNITAAKAQRRNTDTMAVCASDAPGGT